MRTRRYLLGALFVIAIVSIWTVSTASQSPAKGNGGTTASAVPRTVDGHPNFEGFWTRADGGVPFAAAKWTPDPPRDALPRIGWGSQPGERPRRQRSERVALVIDPPDGKIPPYTSEGQKRMDALVEYRRQHDNGNIYDSWEDVGLYSRCLTRGVPGAITSGGEGGGGIQIVQGPGYLTILYPTIHETRVIPLDGRPHAPSSIRSWLGDSTGRWEGDTLVVDMANFRSPVSFTGSAWETDYIPVTDQYHVVERFTRLDRDQLEYRATISDPGTFTSPFTIQIMFRPDRETQEIYEDACHEGNRGLEGILSASRALERKQAGGESGKK